VWPCELRIRVALALKLSIPVPARECVDLFSVATLLHQTYRSAGSSFSGCRLSEARRLARSSGSADNQPFLLASVPMRPCAEHRSVEYGPSARRMLSILTIRTKGSASWRGSVAVTVRQICMRYDEGVVQHTPVHARIPGRVELLPAQFRAPGKLKWDSNYRCKPLHTTVVHVHFLCTNAAQVF